MYNINFEINKYATHNKSHIQCFDIFLSFFRQPALLKRPSPERVTRPYLHYESLESSPSVEAPYHGSHYDRHRSRNTSYTHSKNSSTPSCNSGTGSYTGGCTVVASSVSGSLTGTTGNGRMESPTPRKSS